MRLTPGVKIPRDSRTVLVAAIVVMVGLALIDWRHVADPYTGMAARVRAAGRCPAMRAVNVGALPPEAWKPAPVIPADAVKSLSAAGSKPVLRPDVRLFACSGFCARRILVTAERSRQGWTYEAAAASIKAGAAGPRVARGVLPAPAAARLDRILADPCLAEEPARLSAFIPLRRGGLTRCANGSDVILETNLGGRHTRSARSCVMAGLAGEAAQILTARLQFGIN